MHVFNLPKERLSLFPKTSFVVFLRKTIVTLWLSMNNNRESNESINIIYGLVRKTYPDEEVSRGNNSVFEYTHTRITYRK